MHRIRGAALPVTGTGGWLEHTYVETDNGLRWGCGGRSEGGSLVVEAEIGSLDGPICHALPEAAEDLSASLVTRTPAFVSSGASRRSSQGRSVPAPVTRSPTASLSPQASRLLESKAGRSRTRFFMSTASRIWPEAERCARLRSSGLYEHLPPYEFREDTKPWKRPSSDGSEHVSRENPGKLLIDEISRALAVYGHRADKALASEIAAILTVAGIDDLDERRHSELVAGACSLPQRSRGASRRTHR